MFHVQERQFSFSSLFKKPVHNAVRPFSCHMQEKHLLLYLLYIVIPPDVPGLPFG